MGEKQSFRAVFMSDVHLGALSSRADDAAEFLKRLECQRLYLVGDIIDMWRLRSRWHWPESHNRFVRRVLKMSKRGTRVIYIPGNHDEHARPYLGLSFGGVEMARRAVHETVRGEMFLVTHGDEADLAIRHAPWLSRVGGAAYDLLVVLNRLHNRLLLLLGRKPWSLSQAIKGKVKRACQHVARFEETLAHEARRRKLDGVICGHIHKAEDRLMPDGTRYINCGDWVEGASAVVEELDGTIRVVEASPMLGTPAHELPDDTDHDVHEIEDPYEGPDEGPDPDEDLELARVGEAS